MREFTGMAPDAEWDELRFNSAFENGNLDMVVRTGESTYDLFLRADTNTMGHFGWFHFEVARTRKGQTVHFNVVNMTRPGCLYNHGMLVNMWSLKRNQPRFVGWERAGFNLKYGPTNRNMGRQRKGRQYFTLSFSVTFDYEDDKVWFASTIPYTYSMLTQYIKAISAEQKSILSQGEKRCKYLQESVLCKSLGGVEVPLLTITNFDGTDEEQRQVVVVQARVHPGETASSWIVHGLISFLISRSRVANELRKRHVFKILPMANPDGVIIGNTRTTLIGKDMNR
jgi:hypothetical protein